MENARQKMLISLQANIACAVFPAEGPLDQTSLNNALKGQRLVDAFAVKDAYENSNYRLPAVLRFEDFDLSLGFKHNAPVFASRIHYGDALEQLEAHIERIGNRADSCLYWARICELKECCGETLRLLRCNSSPCYELRLELEEHEICLAPYSAEGRPS